jgi:hypothetical protein
MLPSAVTLLHKQPYLTQTAGSRNGVPGKVRGTRAVSCCCCDYRQRSMAVLREAVCCAVLVMAGQ